MAKVSLRIYNREIERLIEQGHMDEAIAHCRHILKTFPKHLETYRILGKAYLEARRYNEVVDVFSRLLMAVPDDFVAHVGLSIIRDEENKLDDAIWHMERAFEAQPSNPAIQGELQRLYGRRDGVEPPKVRMTRGALARIYVQGELYPQAIAEIRAVLAQDSQRADMQVLLALSYFKSGQKADASDLCNQLLKRYPYCFDANRIMVDLLPATAGSAESTQVYRMRAGELDPYANFAKGSIFQTGETPDASISLERLEYTGEESEEQGWDSSLGIGLGASSTQALTASSMDDQPDWLKSSGFDSGAPQDSPAPASVPQAGDEIPDFLRAAGWGEASGSERPTSIFDEEPAADSELVPADLPDWLKGQAPASSTSLPISEPRPESIETPDWLSGLGGAETEQPAQPADIPDWLGGAEPKAESASSVESLGASAQEQDDAVAWLESLAAKHGAKPEELVTDPDKRSETPPEWVQQAQSIGEAMPKAEDLGASAQEQDDAVAWLESLAVKHGAKPEELVTDPDKRSETPPEWVQQAQSIGGVQPAPPEETAKSGQVEGAQNVGEQFFAEFEGTSTSAPGMDETAAWLRELDEKDKREEPAASSESGESPDWMLPSSEEEKLERGEIPEWLSEPSQPSETQKEASPTEEVMGSQDLSEWLSGLDEEPGLELDPEILRASQRAPFPSPEESTPKPDLPGWLSDAEVEPGEEEEWQQPAASIPTGEPVSTSQGEPVTLTADLPDWLQGVDEESAEASQADEDLPPWGHREQWESEGAIPQQPKPTSPSDWHPVAEKTESAKGRGQTMMQSPPSPEPTEKKRKKEPVRSQARQRKPEAGQGVGLLNQAKAELDRGGIPEALLHYGKLIKKGKHLEEIVSHLSDSLYRYPVEVGIWQALGDAYMRANRLKEALDAYNKAEELIR